MTRVRVYVSHTKVNKRLLTPWNKGMSSNGKGRILITIVSNFLKVFSEICPVLGTIVSKYELWLVRCMYIYNMLTQYSSQLNRYGITDLESNVPFRTIKFIIIRECLYGSRFS